MKINLEDAIEPDQGSLVERCADRVPDPPQVTDPIAARRPAFLANRRLDLVKMQTALALRDFEAMKRIGHNSKGIGAGYGFVEISRLGAAIENAASAEDAGGLEISLLQLESYLTTCCVPSGELV
jgi:hypothetical protein